MVVSLYQSKHDTSTHNLSQLPYFDMETEAYISRNSFDDATAPREKQLADGLSTSFRQMRNLEDVYLASDDIHVARSLDQSYYTGLDNVEAKDLEQVVFRYTSKLQKEEERKIKKGGQ